MSPKDSYNNTILKQDLVNLGLTRLESEIYLYLLEYPCSRFSAVAKDLNILVPSIHRSVSRLKEYGLVRSYGTKPVELEAVDPSVGLNKWTEIRHEKEKYKMKSVLKILRGSTDEQNGLRVEIVEGKHETFIRSIDLVKQLKHEMIILSIGEPIPKELFHAIVQKINEGVQVRMIAEEYHEKNKELLRNWQRNGYKIRHLADPKLDFTLVVYDDAVAMLHIRMDPDRDKRTGIFFYNSGYVKAQKVYLEDLWKKAVDIEKIEGLESK